MKRYASATRADDSGIRAAQQVYELAGVGHRLVPVAVVYARPGAALTCVSQVDPERFAEVIGTLPEPQNSSTSATWPMGKTCRVAAQMVSSVWIGVSSLE